MKILLKKSIKILLWIISSVIILVLILAISLNIPAVQNFVKDKAINYLKEKTKTEISLQSIKIALPKELVINKFYMQDLKKDTLLYAEKLALDISFFKLFSNTVEINNIKLKNIRAHVKRILPDSSFNFSFLTDAFASNTKEPKKQDTSSSALKFAIDKIDFEDIGLTYQDDVARSNVLFYLGRLQTKLKTFDLANQNYVIENVNINNTTFIYRQLKPVNLVKPTLPDTAKTPAIKSKLPTLVVQNFAFNRVKVNYDDQAGNILALANIGKLSFVNLKADLNHPYYGADDAQLANSFVKFAFKPAAVSSTAQKDSLTKDEQPSPLALVIKNIDLINNHLQFDNQSAKAAKGMDFNHLNIRNLNLGVKNLNYSSAGIKVLVKNGSFIDKSGFKLNVLAGDAVYSQQQIRLKNLVLKTPHTEIENQTELYYTSLADLTKHPERVKLKLSLKNTVLGLKDATFFSTAVPANYQTQKISVNAIVNGYMNDLQVHELKINGFKNTQIDVNGNIKGLPNPKKLFLNLTLRKLYVTKGDILAVAPKNVIPASISLPNVVDAKGQFKGSFTNFNTLLNVHTDMGSAVLKAGMSGKKGAEQYQAHVNIRQFNVGKLINQAATVGLVTATVRIKGKGLTPKNINAQLKAMVLSAGYKKYGYKNLEIKGNYAHQIADIKVNMPDSNARFTLNATVNLAAKYPSVKSRLALTKIDFKKLNLSPTDLQFAGNVDVNIPTANPNYLNGDVFATNLQLLKEGKLIQLDTIQLHASSTENSNLLMLRSDLLDAKLSGKYQLTQLGNAFINQINKYYRVGQVAAIAPQNIRFAIHLHTSKYLTDLVPQLTRFNTSKITGYLNTEKDSLLVNAFFPNIEYGSYKVDTMRLQIDNQQQKLNYQLHIKNILSPSIALFYTEISGNMANNNLYINAFLRDRQKKNKYVLGGLLQAINKDFRFSFDPDKLLLDYEKWSISPQNYIQFGQSGMLAHQFNLSQGNQLLSINSTRNVPKAPIQVEFKNLRLETLTKFAETDSTMIGGTLNGIVTLQDLTGTPKFEGDLTIHKLRYLKDDLGDLRAVANNNTRNSIALDVSLNGPHALSLTGFFYTEPAAKLDLALNLKRLDLSKIESLSMNQIKQGKGYFSGNFTLKGAPSKPEILGNLKFNDIGLKIAFINSYFNIPNQEIRLDKEGIKFKEFTLIDSLEKKASIDGAIYTSNLSNMGFNIDFNTDNFRLMNSTSADNNLFYGTVYLTSNIHLTGDMNKPNVKMKANIDKGTQFYFVVPISDPSVIDQAGIVEFIDPKAPPLKIKPNLQADSLNKSSIKGINMVVDINTDPDAQFNILMDPSGSDAMRIKGKATLVAGMDPSGKISFTGKYVVNEGSYTVSIGPAKKTFSLVKGSTLVWASEPTNADVNMAALYNVTAAPIDLLNDPSNVYAKTKMPFLVYLIMKGELLKPNISFKLDIPENQRNALGGDVYAKIQSVNQNPNELNKQVFALLTLGRFIANNPFQSLAGGGGNIASMARSKVSDLLTDQLNDLASNLIKGVDVDFNLNSSEDYSSGSMQQKTDLQVGLSKKMFNDRLTVSVGSSFALEGANAHSSKAANIAGNINLEYALSTDGRYRLRAYRRNQTDLVIEGQIIETGLGFTLVVDYNKFKEVFKSRKNRYNPQKNQ